MARLAKTSVPTVRCAVLRERLFARLDGSPERPIAWVAGPPGAGKTLLVATYVEARKRDCVWYHVDAGDADLASFFFYLAGAARSGRRGRRNGLPLLTPEYQGNEAAFARTFFRHLVSTSRRPFVLVVDDVSEVARDATMHLALREGLEELGPGARAILVSREEPPPAYARLVASGAVDALSGDDLRLTEEEALAIAERHAPAGIPRAALEHVCEVAGGWAAGIVLLASGAGLPERDAPTRTALFEYLATEVFERASPLVRDVLLSAAVVAPVPARLADRLCGSDRAAAVLEDLASRAYFTTRRPLPDVTFQLHPLLRRFLLSRTESERGPDALRRLRTRAAAILEEEGLPEDALSLLVEAGAWEDVARVALAEAPALVATGRSATLERWLRSLPAQLERRQPWISYWLARCRLGREPSQARLLLAESYRQFEEAGDGHGLYATSIAALEAILLEWTDFSGADVWIDRVARLRQRGAPVPSELELALTSVMFGLMTFHRNDSPELLEWEDRALAIVRDPSVPAPVRLGIGSWFVVECALRGEIRRSASVVELLAPLARSERANPLGATGWLASEAVHHWHSGEPEQAIAAVERGLALVADSGIHAWAFLLHLQGVNAALAGDDLPRARAHLAAAEATRDPARPFNVAVLEHERGLIALRAGDLEAACGCARAVIASGERAAMPFFRCIGALMLAIAATSRGDPEAARPEIEAARRFVTSIRSSLAEFLCELCEAELARRRGDPGAARDHLGRALSLSREKGVVPDAWFTRSQLADLCLVALEGGVEPEHARRLVRRLRLDAPAGAESEEWPWAVRVHLLGPLAAWRDDGTLRFRTAARRHPLDLLAAIAATGSRSAPEHALEDALWPESERAHHALETSLYRLRRLLGDGVVHLGERTLSLDARRCWVDAIALERLLARADARLGRRDPGGALEAAERAVGLYRGPFLAGRDTPWILAARGRLRRRLKRALDDLARHEADPAALRRLRARVAAVDPALDAPGLLAER